MSFYRFSIVPILTVAALASGASAALTNPGLTGNTQTDVWASGTLNSGVGNYPGRGTYPGSGNWNSGPAFSQTGDANIAKASNGTGGGPYVGSASIYFGGISSTPNTLGGAISINDATPVANVTNVVLQIEIGEAFGYDFFNNAPPKLNYSGGSQLLSPVNSGLLSAVPDGTFTTPEGPQPVYRNTWIAQYDLTGLGAISSLSAVVTAVQHAQIYGVRLDQSDTFALVAVPEPTSLAVVGGAVTLLLRRRR